MWNSNCHLRSQIRKFPTISNYHYYQCLTCNSRCNWSKNRNEKRFEHRSRLMNNFFIRCQGKTSKSEKILFEIPTKKTLWTHHKKFPTAFLHNLSSQLSFKKFLAAFPTQTLKSQLRYSIMAYLFIRDQFRRDF